MFPPAQGFKADNLAASKGNDGLVIDQQLASFQSDAEIGLELEPSNCVRVHPGIEDLASRFSRLLGAIHGNFRISNQFFGLAVRTCIQRHADAGVNYDLAPFDLEWNCQSLLNSLPHADRIARAGDIFEEHGKFVSAKPGNAQSLQVQFGLACGLQTCNGVCVAERSTHALRDLHQQLVASRVPQTVIDHLELVDVDKENRKLVVQMPSGSEHRMLQAVEEQIAVRQVGQTVFDRPVVKCLLSPLAVSD